jgi:hypothetical protein
MNKRDEEVRLEHPTLDFIDQLQQTKFPSRRKSRDSLSQDFINVLLRKLRRNLDERVTIEQNLRKKLRLERKMKHLFEDEQKRSEAL